MHFKAGDRVRLTEAGLACYGTQHGKYDWTTRVGTVRRANLRAMVMVWWDGNSEKTHSPAHCSFVELV